MCTVYSSSLGPYSSGALGYEFEGEEVEQLADGEHAGAEQQAQEAAHLTQQTHEHERLLLANLRVTQLRVEDVYLHEVVPVKCNDTALNMIG